MKITAFDIHPSKARQSHPTGPHRQRHHRRRRTLPTLQRLRGLSRIDRQTPAHRRRPPQDRPPLGNPLPRLTKSASQSSRHTSSVSSTSHSGTSSEKMPACPATHSWAAQPASNIPLYWSVGLGWIKDPRPDARRRHGRMGTGIQSLQDPHGLEEHTGKTPTPPTTSQMFKLVRDFLPNNIYLGFDANNGYSVPNSHPTRPRLRRLRTHRPLRGAAPPVRPSRTPPSRRRPRRRHLHRRAGLGPLALPRHHP